MWLSTIEWKHLDKPVRFKDCYPTLPVREPKVILRGEDDLEAEVADDEDDSDEDHLSVNHRKISQFRFATDAEQLKLDKEIDQL